MGAIGSLDLRSGRGEWFGSASRTGSPASFDYGRVAAATAESRTIRREGVRRGTARHALLHSRLRERIRRAAAVVGRDAGHDCVVAKRDIENDNGLTVTDVSDEMARVAARTD